MSKIILINMFFITLFSASSCPPEHKPPKVELCVIGSKNLICNDMRLSEGSQDYTRSFSNSINYLATNPQDFKTYRNWVEGKIKELVQCQSRSSFRNSNTSNIIELSEPITDDGRSDLVRMLNEFNENINEIP